MDHQTNGNVFIEKEPSKSDQSPVELNYIHNTESENYISQFLCDDASIEHSRDKLESAPLMLGESREVLGAHEDHSENSASSRKREKSFFHNFQKHLVITLKKIVKIRPTPDDGLAGKIGLQMWEIFFKSHLYTKNILHIIYGAQGKEQQECYMTSSMLNKFGYMDFFNQHSEAQISEAQEYLRKETVKAVKNVNIKQYLTKRRLKKSEDFQEYLNEFIEELENGPIRKRIPKYKKKNLRLFQEHERERA